MDKSGKSTHTLVNRSVFALIGFVALVACSPASDSDSSSAAGDYARGNQAEILQVAAEYDGEIFRLHYRLEVPNPSWYHQYWLYQNGEWKRMGSGADGPDEYGLYEDRISMLLDDGSVEGFSRYGGWMLAHPGMRSFDSAVSAEEVRQHPLLGQQMGRSDVRKYIPQSRNIENYARPAPWDDVKSENDLRAMQERGEFLDLWQWRAHRSHPVGYADNGYVLHYRLSSEGQSMYRDNQHPELSQPAWMFDPETTGKRSLDWNTLIARGYSQDDLYYLSEDNAVPFDPDYDWQDGDVIPFRFLQQPDGARGAIRSHGRYQDGAWRITLERTMESPQPLDSKTLQEGQIYHVAFAVHHGAVGARHHRVSLPFSMSLGAVQSGDETAEIVAQFSETPLKDSQLDWYRLGLIRPGQVDWAWLTTNHPGGGLIRSDIDVGVADHHGYLPLLQRYIDRRDRRMGLRD